MREDQFILVLPYDTIFITGCLEKIFMPQPWLSVLIPVYNVEEYLEDCIYSVISQIDTDVEVVLVDDCSTDGSLLLAETIVKNSSCNIRLLRHEKNGGLSAARNTLLHAACGRYIWFLDSDDLLKSDAIVNLKNIVDMHNPELVLCDYSVFYGASYVPKNKKTSDKHVRSFLGDSGILYTDPDALFYGVYRPGKLHIWSKISKRDLWFENESLIFPVGKYFEDMTTTPRLMLRAKSFYYCDQPWVFYRRRKGSILSSPSIKKIDHMLYASDGVMEQWLEIYPNLSEKSRYAFMCFMLKIFRFAYKDLKRLREDSFRMKALFGRKFSTLVHCDRIKVAFEFIKRRDIKRFFWFIFLVRYFDI